MKQQITIDINEYKKLLLNNEKLNILESDGVDNWIGYMEGYKDRITYSFISLFPNLIPYETFIDILSLKDIVDFKILKIFKPEITYNELLNELKLLDVYIEILMDEGTDDQIIEMRKLLNV